MCGRNSSGTKVSEKLTCENLIIKERGKGEGKKLSDKEIW